MELSGRQLTDRPVR